MSVGARLREERLRLGMSQPAFAALAGVTKGALVKWEKDTASPNASALIAFSEAGADAIYILTGKRMPAVPDISDALVREDLDRIERDLVNPAWGKLPHESIEDAEARIRIDATNKLTSIIEYEAQNMPDNLIERAKSLLHAVGSPQKLSLLRAVDFAQARKRREDEKELLGIWLEQWPYHPDHAVMEIMARIVVDYGVPHGTLAELANEIYTDVEEQRSAESIIRLHDQQAKCADN
jgi:transcriptional regulator with XRE-family HTH domain